jgi:MFS transporter, putative metabolite:H+ symporter
MPFANSLRIFDRRYDKLRRQMGRSSNSGGEAALIRARLDRLPTTRYIWKLVLLLSLGGCFEFYDLFLMTYIGPGLVRAGLFTGASVSFFGISGLGSFVAATFAGLFIGTLVFGFTADRFGRRAIFTFSLLWYTAASVVMACQTTTSGILLWRLIAGIGIGVELVTIDTYIAELMPTEIRGRAFALNQVVQFMAIPVVALVAWRLAPLRPLGIDGWRWVVLIGSVSAIFVWFIRRGIPESPRWLIARGRLREAGEIVERMEARVAAESGEELPRVTAESAAEPASGGALSFARIFHPPYLGRTAMLTVFQLAQTIGYYGFASWVPTLLISAGIRTTASLEYSFVIAIFAPVGPLLVQGIADRFERKWQIVWSAVCVGGFGLLFARQHEPGWLIVMGVLLTCSNNWMSVAFHAYQAELFPTAVRAQAVGFVYSWSRFSAIFTSLMIGFFLAHFGVRGVFAFIAAAMLTVVVAIGFFGPRTRGLALESISN